MNHLKSVLNNLLKEIMQIKNLDEAKTKMRISVESTNIKNEDKKKMLREIQTHTNLIQLQKYCCNLVFKYEGLGVGYGSFH